MLRNYFLINLLLLTIIGFLGIRMYRVYNDTPEIPTASTVKKAAKDSTRPPRKDKVVTDAAFDVISQLDLFRPSRSAPVTVEKKTAKQPMTNPPKLFGTIILNENKSAIIEDPDTKSTKVYRLNDSIAGYTLSKIEEDKVVLSRDGDNVEIKLREDKKIAPQRRAPARSTVQSPAARQNIRRSTPSRPRSRPVPPRRRPTRRRPPADPAIRSGRVPPPPANPVPMQEEAE